MSDLIQPVNNGTVDQTRATNTKKGPNNELGKDAFLQLLVTQMKYQDPLNPNTDTEYIAQLATFSQLEQMQNISQLTTNSQAFSLVGKEVVVKVTGSTGTINYVSGRVDYVQMANGKAKLSINGSLYDIDQLDSVIDDTYLIEQGLPAIKEKIELSYDGNNPKDLSFDVFLGSGDTVATKVAVAIGDSLVKDEYVKLVGSKITIDKQALANLGTGVHKVTVVFNDPFFTTVTNKITINVVNGKDATDNPDTPGSDDNENTDGTGNTDGADNTSGSENAGGTDGTSGTGSTEGSKSTGDS